MESIKSHARKRRLALVTLTGVAALWVGLDQLAKWWALKTLPVGKNVQVLGETLQWHLAYNPGAAFSLLSNATWIFTLLAAVTIIVIVVKVRALASYRWAVAVGLLLGGTLGNLIDRLLRPPTFGGGYVVDFIYTPWLLPAIYNVADIGLTLAVLGLIGLMWAGVPYQVAAPLETTLDTTDKLQTDDTQDAAATLQQPLQSAQSASAKQLNSGGEH